jgi:hypothetical protein
MTFHTLGIVTPTDFHIFQRGRYTTNQIKLGYIGMMISIDPEKCGFWSLDIPVVCQVNKSQHRDGNSPE